MEKEMVDGLFWLPTEFLNDVDDDVEIKSGKSLFGFGVGLGTELSSPGESVMGSCTESDEEEYLNELTRKLAQSTLEEDEEDNHFYEPQETKSTRVVVGSPQSTLCGWKQSSSRGSPNCVSPAAPPMSNDGNALDVLYAAAGEVARMKMNGYNTNVNVPQEARKPPSHNLQFHQIQAAQKQMMMKKQQQQYHQMMQRSRVMNGCGNMNAPAPLSAWPTLQQAQQQPQPGLGMRAVFLGNQNPKRECSGTGVFLPRQVGAPLELRKKKGCSTTVLLPDKVVQALNLNLQAQPQSNGGRAPYDYEAQMKYRNNVMMAEQQRQQAELDHLRLPQEWTY